AATKSENDYRDFMDAMSVIDGDRVARITLQHIVWVGTPEERARAADGFVRGGNDRVDAPGLVWGFILFNRWATFADAVTDWARGDRWAGELLRLGQKMHAAAANGAAPSEMAAFMPQALELNAKLSANEAGYARRMGEASRIALRLTLVTFMLLSLIACG